MAKLNAFSVYDSKAMVYQRPFFSLTEGEATRAFSDEVKRPESPFNAHPHDYTLIKIGYYEDHSGALEQIENISIMTAIEALNYEQG